VPPPAANYVATKFAVRAICTIRFAIEQPNNFEVNDFLVRCCE
jgi:NADP-dependent 3-hydroxy acid dehydrogenase YdfG